MATFEVVVSKEAEEDLDSIYRYLVRSSGVEQANCIEDRLIEGILSLEKTPGRGKCPPEMLNLGITDYREIQLPPWRIFYGIEQDKVGVVAIIDGRRNVAELLQRRLLQ